MRECAPLAGPANAGEKSEKSYETVVLNSTPKYRNAVGCPVYSAGAGLSKMTKSEKS
ncbi:MAG: hypothetical protein WCV67_07590 [Victivallaceae bacterium]